jgi:hypothetical protein
MKASAKLLGIILVTVATPALADGYISLGIGSPATLGGDLEQKATPSDVRSSRLTVGKRFVGLSLEAGLSNYGLAMAGKSAFSGYALGAGLKFNLGLLGPVEGYGRAAMEHTWLRSQDSAMSSENFSGNGWSAGAGLEIPIGRVSLWGDYSRHSSNLYSSVRRLDSIASMWLAGLAVTL